MSKHFDEEGCRRVMKSVMRCEGRTESESERILLALFHDPLMKGALKDFDEDVDTASKKVEDIMDAVYKKLVRRAAQ